MAYFQEKKTEKIDLATDSNYWVEVLLKLTWGDMKKIADLGEDGQISYKVDALLTAMLVGWNLDDASGAVLPITAENIDKLQREDIEKIITILNGRVEESPQVKKDSSPKS